MTMASGARVDLRDIRPLQFRELIDAPYGLVRSGGWSMLLVMLAAAISTLGATSLIDSSREVVTNVTWVVLVSILVSIPFRVLTAGIVTVTSAAAVTGRPIGRLDPWKVLRTRLFGLCGIRLRSKVPSSLTWLGLAITCLGAAVAPLGAAYVGASQLLAQPVLLLEGSDIGTASRRSAELVGPLRVRCAGLAITQWVVLTFLGLSSCIGPPLVLANFYPDWVGITALGVSIAVWLQLCTAVMASVRVTTYFDIRCRREGLDLIMRAAT